MANGEKFCIDFPNIRIEVFVSYVQVVGENYEFNNLYPLKWWNAEYKEPTTKNDLGVDLVSRADVLKLMQDNWHTHNGDWAMQESMDDIRALPSVTPQEPILDRVRAEIETKYGQCDICEYDAISGWEQVSDIADILQIIDKYKAESEQTDGNDD